MALNFHQNMDKINMVLEAFRKNMSRPFRHLFWFLKTWREKNCAAFPALIPVMNNITTIKCASETFMAGEYLKHRYLAEQMQVWLEERIKKNYIQLALSDNLHTTLISSKDCQWIQRKWNKFCTSERSLWLLKLHIQGRQENAPCQN